MITASDRPYAGHDPACCAVPAAAPHAEVTTW
jgi:hypothetical protein